MNPLITFLLYYLAGVFVMGIIIRCVNAKEKRKHACLEPGFSLLSWFGVVVSVLICLIESCKNGYIAKLFNYTDKPF